MQATVASGCWVFKFSIEHLLRGPPFHPLRLGLAFIHQEILLTPIGSLLNLISIINTYTNPITLYRNPIKSYKQTYSRCLCWPWELHYEQLVCLTVIVPCLTCLRLCPFTLSISAWCLSAVIAIGTLTHQKQRLRPIVSRAAQIAAYVKSSSMSSNCCCNCGFSIRLCCLTWASFDTINCKNHLSHLGTAFPHTHSASSLLFEIISFNMFSVGVHRFL